LREVCEEARHLVANAQNGKPFDGGAAIGRSHRGRLREIGFPTRRAPDTYRRGSLLSSILRNSPGHEPVRGKTGALAFRAVFGLRTL